MQHGEEGFVKMTNSLDAIGGIQLQLWTRLAQPCTILRSCNDGDVEHLAWGRGGCWSAASEQGHGNMQDILARSSFCAVAITLGNS